MGSRHQHFVKIPSAILIFNQGWETLGQCLVFKAFIHFSISSGVPAQNPSCTVASFPDPSVSFRPQFPCHPDKGRDPGGSCPWPRSTGEPVLWELPEGCGLSTGFVWVGWGGRTGWELAAMPILHLHQRVDSPSALH